MKRFGKGLIVVTLLAITACMLVACGEGETDYTEIAHNSDYYISLSEDERSDFDVKLEKIISGAIFENMSEEEKLELVNALVESEKLQKEIEEEQQQEETRKEEIKQELLDLTSSQQELEQRLQNLKDSNASEEEIKRAEQEQQNVEEQIKAVDQEKKYYETIDVVKNAVLSNEAFSYRYANLVLRQINGIYRYGGTAYLSGSFIQESKVNGVSIFSSADKFFRMANVITGDETCQEILDILSDNPSIYIEKTCVNFNSKENEEYFEQNKYEIDDKFTKLESRGYELTVEKSWNIEGRDEYPEFIIKATSADDEQYVMIDYNESICEYASPAIKKICPEFWAQMEIENNKQSS